MSKPIIQIYALLLLSFIYISCSKGTKECHKIGQLNKVIPVESNLEDVFNYFNESNMKLVNDSDLIIDTGCDTVTVKNFDSILIHYNNGEPIAFSYLYNSGDMRSHRNFFIKINQGFQYISGMDYIDYNFGVNGNFTYLNYVYAYQWRYTFGSVIINTDNGERFSMSDGLDIKFETNN